MPRRSYKRNKHNKRSHQPDEVSPPSTEPEMEPEMEVEVTSLIPRSYKEAAKLIIIDKPLAEPTKQSSEHTNVLYFNTYPVAEKDIIHWERSWNWYLDMVFHEMIPDEYHTQECYDEFIEIAYLTTPYSYRHNRVARPNDVVPLSFLPNNLMIPFNLLKHRVMVDGYPLFQDRTDQLNIETPFSMYLFNIEPEYVIRETDNTQSLIEVEINGDIFYEKPRKNEHNYKTKPNTEPVEYYSSDLSDGE